MSTAVRKHWKDFAAIIVLALCGLAVAAYILGNQRFYLPRWVPIVGTDFVDYKATFSTAQSVTPGQGQTVQIAGVDVGDITKVDLVDGQAVVTMKIRRRYTPIYKDATALLRPKTGLNDMVVQLDPGTRGAGRAPEGWALPISQTQPNVNADEVLAALDGDTRNYLQMLVGGAGQALKGNSRRLSATLKRFEPTGQALARLNGALATRQKYIRRSIHNFSLLAEALGNKDDQLAQLVDSSNRVFRSFARQDDNLRAALQELPSTLDVANTSLTKAGKLADQLGPTLGALRPGARALGPSLAATRPFLRETTPIIRDQLRPFSRDARPVVRQLRPTARDLSRLTPDLVSSFKVVNYLLNTLAYNPPGQEEGYLFWASWANHAGLTIFNLQDAHGPLRRGLVLGSCSTLQTLRVIGTANERLGTLASLLNPPAVEQACGQKTSQPGAAPTQRSTGGQG